MGGVALSPFLGRFIDHMVPWYATLISSVGATVFYGIQTGTAGLNVAAVIIVCFGIDVLRQMQQVSVATAVLGLDPLARSRMNAVILISVRPLARLDETLLTSRPGLRRADHRHVGRHDRVQQARVEGGGGALHRMGRVRGPRAARAWPALPPLHVGRVEGRLRGAQGEGWGVAARRTACPIPGGLCSTR